MSEITIGHFYPALLNLYGDRGNITALRKRLEWRGHSVTVREIGLGDAANFSKLDIAFLGGGSDREQLLVCKRLTELRPDFRAYIEDGGVLAAICGGYQLLGHYYKMGDEMVEGLSVLDLYTESGEGRLIGNVIIRSPLFARPVVGFENHGGRTYLGDGVTPLGEVLAGNGNNGRDKTEGVLYKNVVGTYLHGPLLPKNPHLCDELIRRALEKKYGSAALSPLDDKEELLANDFIQKRYSSSAKPE